MLARILKGTQAKRKLSPIRGGIGVRRSGSGRLDKNQAQVIVNRYGEALEKANALNGLTVLSTLCRMFEDDKLREEVSRSLAQKTGHHYELFSQKADKSILPYPKKTIREAIELLLQYDKDPDNIFLLKEGLKYLDFFE